MSNNKQSMKLYTEEQLVNTVEAISKYIKNYPEKFHKSMIEKHLKNLEPIELPSDEDIKHCIGSVNYTEYDNGFIQGIKWLKEQILNQNK